MAFEADAAHHFLNNKKARKAHRSAKGLTRHSDRGSQCGRELVTIILGLMRSRCRLQADYRYVQEMDTDALIPAKLVIWARGADTSALICLDSS
jgi:hypothetical protein